MPRKKVHGNNAARQQAYRERMSLLKRNGLALRYEDKTPLKIPRPPVRYYGGKWKIANWILEHFPAHKCYVEPFCGGASLFFRKSPSMFEVLNDINSDVINFFDVLRATPEELIRALQLTPYSEFEHHRAYEPCTDMLERARRFLIRSRQSYGSGEGMYKTGWRYQAKDTRGTSLVNEWNAVEHLWAAAERLKQAQITCRDYRKVLSAFDTPETLFYIDPPYPFSTRSSKEHRYRAEMRDEDHIELAHRLHAVQGHVIVSGYLCPLYEELYQGWKVVSKTTTTNGNNTAVEYLWIKPGAATHEDA